MAALIEPKSYKDRKAIYEENEMIDDPSLMIVRSGILEQFSEVLSQRRTAVTIVIVRAPGGVVSAPPPHRKLSPHPPTLTLFSSSPLYPTAILQERFGSICLLQNREHALDPITPHKLRSVFSVLQP